MKLKNGKHGNSAYRTYIPLLRLAFNENNISITHMYILIWSGRSKSDTLQLLKLFGQRPPVGYTCQNEAIEEGMTFFSLPTNEFTHSLTSYWLLGHGGERTEDRFLPK